MDEGVGMKKYFLIFCILGFVNLIGCAAIVPPAPDKFLSNPLGAGPVHLGMTKNEVKDTYGEPDLIQNIGDSNDKGATTKQEWVYYARMKRFPINYGYLSKTLRIYFDGNNVTKFSEE